MTLQVTDAGLVSRTVSAVEVTDAGNVNRVISEIRVIDSNLVDRVVYATASPFAVSIFPSTVSGLSGTSTITTEPATATATGGTAPYTYAWSVKSYDGPVKPTANSPTSATTTFTQTGIAFDQTYSAVWLCTVTASTTAQATAECSSFWSR